MSEQEQQVPLGWHVISGELLLETLRRAHDGEQPDLLMLELWSNAQHEYHPDEDQAP